MSTVLKKILSTLTASAIFISNLANLSVPTVSAAEAFTVSGGWNEYAYAEWAPVSGANSYQAYYKRSTDLTFTEVDDELVRFYSDTNRYRVDIPGLLGDESYDIKVTSDKGSDFLTTVKTTANDRSGYAHFKYNEGVGAYKDDGTPKDNAIIVYVTNENKNDVIIPGYENFNSQSKGIGWILNNNTSLIEAVTQEHPLIIRIIGTVNGSSNDRMSGATELLGLTGYNSTENGGSKGDNGYMAIIKGAQNLTIEGIGYDATIFGWGISFYHNVGLQGGKNYEVRNLTLKDYPEDGIGSQGELQVGAPIERVWIHNNSFYSGYAPNPTESDKAKGDGSCDFKRGQYYTLSYNYFEDGKKTNLIGASDSNLQYNITFHHNWWNNCTSRTPLVRMTNIHIYNNYFLNNSDQTIDSRASAYVFSESNFFQNARRCLSTTSKSVIKSYKDELYNSVPEGGDVNIVSDRTQQVASNNKYPNFDTNSEIFYYDSINKQSDVTRLTDAATAKAETMAFSGVLKKEPEPPTPISLLSEEKRPENPVNIPHSVVFGSSDFASKLSGPLAANTKSVVENVVYYPAKEYKINSDKMTLKEQGIIFTLDSPADVTITDGGNSHTVALYNEYGVSFLTPSKSQEATGTLPPGTYFIETYTADTQPKESAISALYIEKAASPSPILTTGTASRDSENEAEKANVSFTSDQDITYYILPFTGLKPANVDYIISNNTQSGSMGAGTDTIKVNVSQKTTGIAVVAQNSKKDSSNIIYFDIEEYIEPTVPMISNISAERLSLSNGKVYFTSTEPGTYHYLVTEPSESEPSVTTIESNNSFFAIIGENTINLQGLSGGSKTLYFLIKSQQGILSDVAKVNISEYSILTYDVTLNLQKDNKPWNGNGKSFSLKKGTDEVPLSITGNTLTANIQNGVWKLIEDGKDTQKSVSVDGGNVSDFIDYYTIEFSLTGTCSNHTIKGQYGGNSIDDNGVYIAGKDLIITVSDLSDKCTFEWSGTASGNNNVYEVLSLNSPVNAVCTVNSYAAPVVTELLVTSQPNKLNYFEGESLNLEGLAVTLKYSDSTQKIIAFNDFAENNITMVYTGTTTPVSHGDILTAASHNNNSITINHSGKSIFTNVIYVNKPTQNSYNVKFSLDGDCENHNITATYNAAEISNNDTVIGGGALKITVTDNSDECTFRWSGTATGTSNTYEVLSLNSDINAICTVTAKIPPTLTDISVKSQPAKLNYTNGDFLDLSGLMVTLKYDDGAEKDISYTDFDANNITMLYTGTINIASNGDVLSIAEHNGNSITIIYGDSSTVTNPLYVNDVLPETYNVKFSLDGDCENHNITATYNGTEINNNATVIGGGALKITVTGNSDECTFRWSGTATGTSNTYEVLSLNSDINAICTVTAKTPPTSTGISVKSQPAKLNYINGESLDLSGLIVTLNYDGTEKDITYAEFAANNITMLYTGTINTASNGDVLSIAEHNGNSITIIYGDSSTVTNPLYVNDVLPEPYNVKFSLDGDCENHNITAIYNGTEINNNATVIGGGALKITVTDNSDECTFLWSGTATGTGNIYEVLSLNSDINVICTVTAKAPPTLTGISVKSQPAKLNYLNGESLDLSGLMVTLKYDDGTEKDIPYAEFAANNITMLYTETANTASNGDVLSIVEHHGNSITIIYGDNSTVTNPLYVNDVLPESYNVKFSLDDDCENHNIVATYNGTEINNNATVIGGGVLKITVTNNSDDCIFRWSGTATGTGNTYEVLSLDSDINAICTVTANAPMLKVISAPAVPDSIVEIPVELKNNPGMAAFRLRMHFDKNLLEPVSISNNSILPGYIESNLNEGGDLSESYVTAFWSNTTNITEDGEIFIVKFKVKDDDATLGDIPISIEIIEAFDEKHANVNLESINGLIKVVPFVYGDTNTDGVVDGKDAVRLMQYLAEWPIKFTDTQLEAADAYYDGVVNGKDIIRLSQYLAEWKVEIGNIN